MKQIYVLIFLCTSTWLGSQVSFTKADTLRGSITPEREWWDLTYYHLDIEVDPMDSSIVGSNEIRYKTLKPHDIMQIDLQEPLIIDKITDCKGRKLKWEKMGSAHFVQLRSQPKIGEEDFIIVYYSGHPHVAVRAPWDGGISWAYDNNNKPFVASSCQGIGASIWWPCKDHMYDEVDSMLVSVTVPETLMNVGNGQLRNTKVSNGKKTTEWFVQNPINNYGVNINIGDYVHFDEIYKGEKGDLKCDYYVLRDNLHKAKEQFKQVPMMLDAFEYWFGPYPFYEDGFKLVEAPYLGMEHQSSITYGNQYTNGYRGMDLSATGWGLRFDFIIIHEAGHEWFANNITYKDIADMWIHESFTAYSESLYLEYHYNKAAASDYILGTRSRINNDIPIIGQYGVNSRGSGDMYYKGSNLLHTIRHVIDDDDLWRDILRGLNDTFYHKTVTTEDIEKYIISKSNIDLSAVFDQYLRTAEIPILEYRVQRDGISYRWSNCLNAFNMPVDINLNGESIRIFPNSYWKSTTTDQPIELVEVDRNYYVATMKVF